MSAKVSVVMATGGGRPKVLRRVLQSWEKVNYDNLDFILIDNDGSTNNVDELVKEFPFVTNNYHKQNWQPINKVWRKYGIESTGDYVIFAMADEILGTYDIVNIMLNCPNDRRCSLLTYFLDENETNLLDTVDWLGNPDVIKTLPGFWNHTTHEDWPNTSRKSAGLLAHVNGAWRDYWKWFGWHRDDDFGYLHLDQDVVVREIALDRYCHPIDDHCCYHQFHRSSAIQPEHRLGGYVYKNEAQARLLEPAARP